MRLVLDGEKPIRFRKALPATADKIQELMKHNKGKLIKFNLFIYDGNVNSAVPHCGAEETSTINEI